MPQDENDCSAPKGDKGDAAKLRNGAKVHGEEAQYSEDDLESDRLEDGAVILRRNWQSCLQELHNAEQVIKQLWITSHFGMLSKQQADESSGLIETSLYRPAGV